MNISILGKSWVLSHKETRYVLNFYANILLGSRLSRNVSIRFIYDQNGTGIGSGSSIPLDYYQRTNKFREFEVIVDAWADRNLTLTIIAHEMEHIRQYARGELSCVERNLFKWQGVKYELTEDNYPRTPWEVQARRSEGWLLHFYKKHCNMHELSFG